MKKQLLKSALIAVAGVGLLAGSAMATPVNVTGSNGEQTIEQIVQAKLAETIDANADQITQDAYWVPSYGTTSGAWASMIVEIAGNMNSNIFGIFDKDGSTLDLMNGPANSGDKVSLSWSASGLYAQYLNYEVIGGVTKLVGVTTLALNADISSTFGFYLKNGETIYYSDWTKNTDSSDQMVSYALSDGHYLLAFEDSLYANSDKDFNDMAIMVESVKPVPEPTTMLLFGTGIAGLAGIVRRRNAKNNR